MSQLIYPFWALAAGIMIAAQALVNAKLGQFVGGPVWAALVSFVVGTIAIMIFMVIMRIKIPEVQTDQLQWWMFLGGVMGAVFVITSITVVPHLGMMAMVALFIAGQLIGATLLDHYGILMPEPKPITFQKLVGIGVLALGAYLVLSKSRF
ncbi:MAG: DMT family transporter [Pseudomonadota bacterium]